MMMYIFLLLIVMFMVLQIYMLCKIPSPPRKKVALLLTMYANTDEKRAMYTRNVNRWLRETDLPIFTVDSANRGVDIRHPRLHQTIFKQQDREGKNISQYEIESLQQVDKKYGKEIAQYDYIFKITGKYVVPDILKKSPRNVTGSFVLQSQGALDNHWQHTELVGISGSRFSEIIQDISKCTEGNTKHFEKILPLVINDQKYTYIKLSPIPIPPEHRIARSWGDTLEYL